MAAFFVMVGKYSGDLEMRYKLAIFDWNGTLIDDSFANWAGSNATLKAANRPEITLETYRETMDFPLIHFYNRNGIDSDTYLSNIEAFNAAFFEVYSVEQKKAPLRKGTMELLDALLDKNVELMILSNHVQDHLEEQLAERHVHGKFKHICGNPVFNRKALTRMTKQDRLQKLLDEQNYNPKDAFIIGDSLEEPEIAEKFGMTSISVTWGCFAESRLRKSPTHHVIHDLSELLPILEVETTTKKSA